MQYVRVDFKQILIYNFNNFFTIVDIQIVLNIMLFSFFSNEEILMLSVTYLSISFFIE